jgi:hypothetical protein
MKKQRSQCCWIFLSALGVISNRRQMDASYSPILILTAQWRWRYIDGLALLFLMGIIGGTMLMQLAVHQ